jgi:heat shock protein HslJ
MSIRIPALLLLGALGTACTGQQDGEQVAADSTLLDTLAASEGTMPSLFDITWNLTELNGQAPPTGAGGRPATLLLAAADQRASGFSGCNRMTGTYQHAGDSLSFGPMAMTRMACPDGMALEQQYAAALEGVRTFRLSAAGLELMGDSGTVARFSAVPPAPGE